MLAELIEKINRKETIIGVIGLGYVGLPVAASFAELGFHVIGVDLIEDRVSLINSGKNPIAGDEPGLSGLITAVVTKGQLFTTTDYTLLSNADVVLIDVQTPVNDEHIPRYEALKAACEALGSVLKDGALVIVESTIAPGTTENVVLPILEEQKGGVAGIDFFLGACPERVMPGKLLENLRSMDRVCGGTSPDTAEAMTHLYRHLVEAELNQSDALTAELVKTTENAYRDVQIAFANEVALICEAAGGDVWQVRELVNKVPARYMHLPGAGVGGHCIPKDSWLLAHGARGKTTVRLIPEARAVNDGMPVHMAELTTTAIKMAGIETSKAKVLVLGYSYLEESDDTRNSPSSILVTRLKDFGLDVVIHDPWINEYHGDLYVKAANCDATILMVGHREYRNLDLLSLRKSLRTPIIVDGRHVIDKAGAEDAGLIYYCVGIAKSPHPLA